MNSINFDDSDMLKIIRSLNIKKAHGPNDNLAQVI